MPPNPNPIEGRYQHTINAEQRNAQFRKIIQSIVADHTDCFRCRMLSFCEPKCVSWKQIVGTLNTAGVPTSPISLWLFGNGSYRTSYK
jgi:radical SAM protein with 4Fe4S-binding SPASM domain